MRITKMAVGMGVTVNLGSYQNIKADAMVEVELESSDSPDRVECVLNERARHAVADQLADYVLEVVSNYGMENIHEEAGIQRLLKRSAAYEFIRNLEPQVADNTLRILTEEWLQAQQVVMEDVLQPADVTGASSEPVTIADLELQAEATSAQLDALLDELDAALVVEPDLTNLPPDSEYFGEYPDEDYPDDDDFDDEDDDQLDFDTEPDFDDSDDDEYDADDETPSPDEVEYVDETTEPDTEVEV